MSHELKTWITACRPLSRAVCLTAVTVAQDSLRWQLTATACCARRAVPASSGHRRSSTMRVRARYRWRSQERARICACMHSIAVDTPGAEADSRQGWLAWR
jgi:hypothetical protein